MWIECTDELDELAFFTNGTHLTKKGKESTK